jgi:phage terminase small subunit
LLRNTEIARQIRDGQARRLRRAQLTGDAVLEEIRKVAFSDIRQFYRPDGSLVPPNEWSPDMAACVSSIEVEEMTVGSGDKKRTVGTSKKLRMFDKLNALHMLAKHFKLLNETPVRGGPEIEGEVLEPDFADTTEAELRAEALRLLSSARGRIA